LTQQIDKRDVTRSEADRILQIEESHYIDLKAVEADPAGLSEAVSAFSNTAGGERRRDEAITTNDCYGSACHPAASNGRGEVASSAIDMIRRSRSDTSLFFKSVAIGGGVASDDDRAC
jgi:hypothetical protein